MKTKSVFLFFCLANFSFAAEPAETNPAPTPDLVASANATGVVCLDSLRKEFEAAKAAVEAVEKKNAPSLATHAATVAALQKIEQRIAQVKTWEEQLKAVETTATALDRAQTEVTAASQAVTQAPYGSDVPAIKARDAAVVKLCAAVAANKKAREDAARIRNDIAAKLRAGQRWDGQTVEAALVEDLRVANAGLVPAKAKAEDAAKAAKAAEAEIASAKAVAEKAETRFIACLAAVNAGRQGVGPQIAALAQKVDAAKSSSDAAQKAATEARDMSKTAATAAGKSLTADDLKKTMQDLILPKITEIRDKIEKAPVSPAEAAASAECVKNVH